MERVDRLDERHQHRGRGRRRIWTAHHGGVPDAGDLQELFLDLGGGYLVAAQIDQFALPAHGVQKPLAVDLNLVSGLPPALRRWLLSGQRRIGIPGTNMRSADLQTPFHAVANLLRILESHFGPRGRPSQAVQLAAACQVAVLAEDRTRGLGEPEMMTDPGLWEEIHDPLPLGDSQCGTADLDHADGRRVGADPLAVGQDQSDPRRHLGKDGGLLLADRAEQTFGPEYTRLHEAGGAGNQETTQTAQTE